MSRFLTRQLALGTKYISPITSITLSTSALSRRISKTIAAMAPFDNDKLVVHLPIDPPPGWLDRMHARFPSLKIHWEKAEVVPSGLSSLDELPEEVTRDATMVCLYPPPSAERMKNVRFVQLASAGSDRWIEHAKYKDPEVLFCSSSGVHPPQIAEWVIGTWLSHVHVLSKYAMDKETETWAPKTHYPGFGTDSVGRRMGILGYGAIGRNCARIAQAMGMQVYAYTHTPRETADSRQDTSGYRVPGTGDPDGTIPEKWFSGSVDDFLAQDLDILVVAVPLQNNTRGLLGERQFEILSKNHKKTFISNVARGPIVDTDALIEALEKGKIAGAALDVTDPEPLPKGHKLWKAPNCFISPHVSWQSTNVFSRVAEILYSNLERLDKGEALLNRVKRDGIERI